MCGKAAGAARWEALDQGIWTIWRPLRFFGLPLGTRMTVVRLSNGDLWVHSAFDPGPELRQQMDAQGKVSYVVCPNRMHHMLVGELLAHYPEAQLHLSRVLPSKRPDLAFGQVLEEEGPPQWSPDLEHHCLRGHLFLDEILFFHRPSRTLIVTDLLWGSGPEAPWYLRWLTALGRGRLSHATPPEMRPLFYPRQEARQSLETVLEWDFERIVLAHGPLVESGGRDLFRRAFGFLLN